MSVNPNLLLLEMLLDEIDRLRRLQQEVIENKSEFTDKAPQTMRDLRGVASCLADIYQGAENAFQRIVQTTGEELPTGEQWHRDLLDQMRQEVKTIRPAVLQLETSNMLEEYLRFRHVFRHNYGFDFEWAKMKPLLERAESTIEKLIADLENFCDFLKQVL